MPEEMSPSERPPVASWRRYIILGGVALVAIAVSVVIVSRRPSPVANNTSTTTSLNDTGQNTITGRPTFERFQASTNTSTTPVPTVTQPTLEQTRQAIKELQQQ